jgi:protease I
MPPIRGLRNTGGNDSMSNNAEIDSRVNHDVHDKKEAEQEKEATAALSSEVFNPAGKKSGIAEPLPDSILERAAVFGKAAALSAPEGVKHALLGVDHVAVPFSRTLAGKDLTVPVPTIVENAAVGAAIGFAARTLLPNAGILGKVGSAALGVAFLAPVAGEGYKIARDVSYAKNVQDLQFAGSEFGTTVGNLAGGLPVGIYSYKFGADMGGKLLATETMAPFANARADFYDAANQKLSSGIDAASDGLKSAFALKPEYTGSHSVAESYERIPQSLVEKLKGDDYKLPTEKLEPGSGKGVRALILTGHGVEAPEFTEVYKALKESGADVKVATPDWMWDWQKPRGEFSLAQWMENQHVARADMKISEGLDMLKRGDIDAVYVPGGAGNTAALRTDAGAQQLVRSAHELDKDIWTICHGGQVLISSEAFPKGTVLTGSPDIRPQDLPNAGFKVPTEQVAFDAKARLLSGQDPNALNPFIKGIGERLAAIKAEKAGSVAQQIAESSGKALTAAVETGESVPQPRLLNPAEAAGSGSARYVYPERVLLNPSEAMGSGSPKWGWNYPGDKPATVKYLEASSGEPILANPAEAMGGGSPKYVYPERVLLNPAEAMGDGSPKWGWRYRADAIKYDVTASKKGQSV